MGSPRITAAAIRGLGAEGRQSSAAHNWTHDTAERYDVVQGL